MTVADVFAAFAISDAGRGQAGRQNIQNAPPRIGHAHAGGK